MSKSMRGFSTIIIVIVLLVLVGAGAYYFGTQKGSLIPIPTVTSSPVGSASPSISPEAKENEITSVDATWNLYTNDLFGYSIKIPKTSFEYGGVCTNGKLDVGQVLVKVFNDNTSAYITYEYFYEYPANNSCQKTENSFSIVDQRANQWKTLKPGDQQPFVPGNWHIITANVENDSQLDQFLKDNWGSGCKLGTKTLNSAGIYDVKIEGDGLGLDTTKCPINFMVAVKYSSEFKKAATWAMGQAPVFPKVADFMTVYDQDMASSFKFIK